MPASETPMIQTSPDGFYVVQTQRALYYIPTQHNLRVDATENAIVCEHIEATVTRKYPFSFDDQTCAQDVFDRLVALANKDATSRMRRATVPRLIASAIVAVTLGAIGAAMLVTGDARSPSFAGTRADAPAPLTDFAPPEAPASGAVASPSGHALTQAAAEHPAVKMKVVPGDSALPHSFAVEQLPQ